MSIHIPTTNFTKPYQQTTHFTRRYSRRNMKPLSSVTLYQSKVGRNAKPYALLVTSQKERETSTYLNRPHNLYYSMIYRSRAGTDPHSNIIIHQFLITFINCIL
ncbi:hypothetical protein CsSME_00037873 [Camellia sinensis var. sinensis]